MRYLVLCLLMGFSLLVQAQQKPDVLLMMSGHAAKAKGDLLVSLAKDQPFNFINFSTKGKSEEEVKAAWKNAQLILLDGINPALSKYMFAKYQGHLKQFKNVPVVRINSLQNTCFPLWQINPFILLCSKTNLITGSSITVKFL